MRTSFRLTPKAQRKKRLVIKMNGKTYFRSVSGADGGAKFPPLDRDCGSGQSAIEMNVAAVDKNVLAGDVAGLGRDQGQKQCCNLFGLRSALAKWKLGDDVL